MSGGANARYSSGNLQVPQHAPCKHVNMCSNLARRGLLIARLVGAATDFVAPLFQEYHS